MDTNQPTTPITPTTATTYTTVNRPPGMFGSKGPSSIAFLVALLLFLLPFAEIRCGGTKFATKSGLDIAMGNDWKAAAGGFGGEELKSKTTNTGAEQEGNTRYYIFAALGLGALGLLLSLGSGKIGGGGAILTGVLAAGALVAFMLELKKNVENSLREQAMEKASEGAESIGIDKMGDVKLTLAFTPWFYIAIVAFLVAAYFGYQRMRASRT